MLLRFWRRLLARFAFPFSSNKAEYLDRRSARQTCREQSDFVFDDLADRLLKRLPVSPVRFPEEGVYRNSEHSRKFCGLL